MIYDTGDREVPQIVKALEVTTYEFWLTGSRFFGTAKPKSDWDFIAKYSDELYAELITLGFKDPTSPESEYRDTVLEHSSPDGVVQVSMCDSPRAKVMVRDFVMQHLVKEHSVLPNKDRNTFWWAMQDAIIPVLEYKPIEPIIGDI